MVVKESHSACVGSIVNTSGTTIMQPTSKSSTCKAYHDRTRQNNKRMGERKEGGREGGYYSSKPHPLSSNPVSAAACRTEQSQECGSFNLDPTDPGPRYRRVVVTLTIKIVTLHDDASLVANAATIDSMLLRVRTCPSSCHGGKRT